MINRKNIWKYKQNKPSLIVKDIKEKYPEIDEDFIYQVLLQRGVFKWLACRRDLIKLKNELRDMLTLMYRNGSKTQRNKGFKNAIEYVRAEIRRICHSDRWRAPDFDKKLNKYLEKLEMEESHASVSP